MIADDERERIVERIRIESDVRKQLEKDEATTKPSRWRWAESKLGLLIIGAALSGVLIPWFQATQESIRWTRQNRYDNLKYRLESVRSSMRELTLTHAFIAEAYERVKMIEGKSPARENELQSYKVQVLDMQYRRFQQNAKFAGALGLLDETIREPVRIAFNKYLSSVQQYMHVLELISKQKFTLNGVHDPLGEKHIVALDSLSNDVNTDYKRTLELLKSYLYVLEKQSEKYY